MIVSLTDDYLTAVVLNDERKLNSLVFWPALLENEGLNGSRYQEDLLKQLQGIKGRWTVENNPLLGLEVINVVVSGDNAQISLRKAGRPGFPKVWVKWQWMGRGWLVVEDSLFGKDGLLATTSDS